MDDDGSLTAADIAARVIPTCSPCTPEDKCEICIAIQDFIRPGSSKQKLRFFRADQAQVSHIRQVCNHLNLQENNLAYRLRPGVKNPPVSSSATTKEPEQEPRTVDIYIFKVDIQLTPKTDLQHVHIRPTINTDPTSEMRSVLLLVRPNMAAEEGRQDVAMLYLAAGEGSEISLSEKCLFFVPHLSWRSAGIDEHWLMGEEDKVFEQFDVSNLRLDYEHLVRGSCLDFEPNPHILACLRVLRTQADSQSVSTIIQAIYQAYKAAVHAIHQAHGEYLKTYISWTLNKPEHCVDAFAILLGKDTSAGKAVKHLHGGLERALSVLAIMIEQRRKPTDVLGDFLLLFGTPCDVAWASRESFCIQPGANATQLLDISSRKMTDVTLGRKPRNDTPTTTSRAKDTDPEPARPIKASQENVARTGDSMNIDKERDRLLNPRQSTPSSEQIGIHRSASRQPSKDAVAFTAPHPHPLARQNSIDRRGSPAPFRAPSQDRERDRSPFVSQRDSYSRFKSPLPEGFSASMQGVPTRIARDPPSPAIQAIERLPQALPLVLLALMYGHISGQQAVKGALRAWAQLRCNQSLTKDDKTDPYNSALVQLAQGGYVTLRDPTAPEKPEFSRYSLTATGRERGRELWERLEVSVYDSRMYEIEKQRVGVLRVVVYERLNWMLPVLDAVWFAGGIIRSEMKTPTGKWRYLVVDKLGRTHLTIAQTGGPGATVLDSANLVGSNNARWLSARKTKRPEGPGLNMFFLKDLTDKRLNEHYADMCCVAVEFDIFMVVAWPSHRLAIYLTILMKKLAQRGDDGVFALPWLKERRVGMKIVTWGGLMDLWADGDESVVNAYMGTRVLVVTGMLSEKERTNTQRTAGLAELYIHALLLVMCGCHVFYAADENMENAMVDACTRALRIIRAEDRMDARRTSRDVSRRGRDDERARRGSDERREQERERGVRERGERWVEGDGRERERTEERREDREERTSRSDALSGERREEGGRNDGKEGREERRERERTEHGSAEKPREERGRDRDRNDRLCANKEGGRERGDGTHSPYRHLERSESSDRRDGSERDRGKDRGSGRGDVRRDEKSKKRTESKDGEGQRQREDEGDKKRDSRDGERERDREREMEKEKEKEAERKRNKESGRKREGEKDRERDRSRKDGESRGSRDREGDRKVGETWEGRAERRERDGESRAASERDWLYSTVRKERSPQRDTRRRETENENPPNHTCALPNNTDQEVERHETGGGLSFPETGMGVSVSEIAPPGRVRNDMGSAPADTDTSPTTDAVMIESPHRDNGGGGGGFETEGMEVDENEDETKVREGDMKEGEREGEGGEYGNEGMSEREGEGDGEQEGEPVEGEEDGEGFSVVDIEPEAPHSSPHMLENGGIWDDESLPDDMDTVGALCTCKFCAPDTVVVVDGEEEEEEKVATGTLKRQQSQQSDDSSKRPRHE